VGKTKVMVVDDSAFMRKILADIINDDPDLEVVATARDGVEALEVLAVVNPDVVTLDVTMPRRDGLATLRQIMATRPLPVVMVSSLTQENASTTIEALRLGAVDFVGKPGRLATGRAKMGEEVRRKIKVASMARPRPAVGKASQPGSLPRDMPPALSSVVVIASSTGGPGALHEVVPRLSPDVPAGYLVVQHMPAGFTKSLSTRLNHLSVLCVQEAGEGAVLRDGHVLVAPGGFHMVVDAKGTISLNRSPSQHGVRPAADVTMISAANAFGRYTVGAVLTGMGCDGTKGLQWIKKAGGRTLAQDAKTSVIHGMPGSAIKAGCVDLVVPLSEIAGAISRFVREQRGQAS